MICLHCQNETGNAACLCQRTAGGTHRGEDADWRRQVRQRTAQYRERREQRHPEAAAVADLVDGAEAALEAAPAGPRRVLAFPAAAAAMRRPLASAELEPLADPVVAPRPRAAEPFAAPAPEAPAQSAPLPVELTADFQLAPEDGLAEPVARPLPERRWVQPRSLLTLADPDDALRIALPLVTNPRTADSEELEQFPVARPGLRLMAGMTDAAVVAAASAVFALAAWAAAHFAAPDAHTFRHLLPALVAVPALLAAVYPLLCFDFAGATPGMRAAGLTLAGCDGPVTAAARRRRAWASLLSLGALGLGFFWMYCDPQQLTWHDAISRTYLVED